MRVCGGERWCLRGKGGLRWRADGLGTRIAGREFEERRAKDRRGGETGEFVAFERGDATIRAAGPLSRHDALHHFDGAEFGEDESGVELFRACGGGGLGRGAESAGASKRIIGMVGVWRHAPRVMRRARCARGKWRITRRTRAGAVGRSELRRRAKYDQNFFNLRT